MFLAWRCICVRTGRVRLPKFQRNFGDASSHCCRDTDGALAAVDREQICAPWSTASFMFCEPAASGRLCLPALVHPAPRIAISRNGHDLACSVGSGKSACEITTGAKGSPGAGNRWMARRPKRRSAGKKTGKNPTDRGKLGVKRSVLTDGRGVPLAVAIAGANAHDQILAAETLKSIPVPRPRPTSRRPQHLCCDKGYHGRPVEQLARRCGYVPHIVPRGEEQRACRRGRKARRWVVERAHSWTNRCRRLLVRWEKKAANYLAFVHLQFAYVTLRAAGVLG
jgi:putative transposase